MKFIIVALCLIGSTLAIDLAKFKDYKEVPIIAQESNIDADGKFHYYYETGLGDKATQDGYLKKIDPQTDAEVLQGAYSFIGDNGVEYKVTYTADENGFHPEGAHLPTSPPIPAGILRSLEYLASHPQAEEKPVYKPTVFKNRF